MHRSIQGDVSIAATLTPIVVNNDTEGKGVGVDLRSYASALAVVHVGVSGDTLSGSLSLLPKLQHSDTDIDGDYADVAAGELDGAFTLIDDPAEDDVVQAVGYLGSKRYLRVVIDTTGTLTNGTPISAVIVRGYPTYAPTA